MSETPQNDSVESEIVEQQEVVTNDSAVDSETTSPVEGESNQQVDEVEVAKQKANDAFNKQYGEKKQLERDLAAQREINSKFEQAERERQAAAVGVIPDMPDAFDDDFDVKVKARDEAIIAQANYNANNQAYLQQQQFQQQNEAQAQQVENQKIVQDHKERTAKLGIKPEEMVRAENAVLQYGLNPDLLAHIASMDDSPLVIKHLAANAQDGYQLATMPVYAVGQFLDGIKTKASALKPKTSSTPNPATNLQGNGVDPEAGKYSHIKGAKFE